jgi:large subunit ribosomal protein L22
MKAVLKNHRQSPRKMRLVAGLLKGKSTDKALSLLSFVPKKASLPIKKLLESAVANAKEKGEDTKKLYIKEIRVDEGITLKRSMPVWRGMAHPIRKRSSHISILLETK